MRIFLIWPSKSPEISILISELEKNLHEIVYWVGFRGGEKYKPLGAIFHDHVDAWAGLPAENVDTSSFLPPDEDLIAKLHQTESHFLTMMNKRYYNMTLDERKHVYYNMLQYWNGIFSKYKPELIIFPNIPHTVYNYLIYELARLYNIKTIMFDDTQIGDRILLLNVWTEGCKALEKEIKNNKDKFYSIEDLKIDLREYYILHAERRGDATPEYMKYYKKLSTGKNFLFHKFKIFINAIKNGTILEKILNFLFKLKINPIKEYKKLQIIPDFSKRFIYVPLHFQPERTTSPMGGVYVDQILMIETLAAALPDNWFLYVKEHPSQMWINGLNYSSCRYPGYYERISRIKNTYLIPFETNSYDLIKNCSAVATVTGTAGWEAILRLKPVITFGYSWYRDCSGVFKVNSTDTCRQAIDNIGKGFRIKEKDVINYLKNLDNASVASQIDRNVGSIKRQSNLSDSQIMINIAQAIINDIK